MGSYDFRTLDDKEFEAFCCDILGEHLGVRFERFKRGRDRGVDGRFFTSAGDEVVLQCKHWADTPVEQLVRRLATDERAKVTRLQPKRYLLAVSNTLSRADKAAIHKALDPFLSTPSDIYGNEDLNDLLARDPAVERRHYKLWLASAEVISHMLNKPIFDRSRFSLEEIINEAKKYVQTVNHERALEKLERLRAVLITGEPGVGKTTLAEHLCLHYVSEGYQFLKISEEIREAEGAFQPNERQVFYFDDFLGRNYLQALSGHEGNHIVQFIRRITVDPTKRFILTSRSTILNQGKFLIDNFRNQNIEKNEFELTVSLFKELDKARILYAHIWHSALAPQYIEQIYQGKRYRHIIAHRNYNPRLISFITDSDRVESCAPDEYWGHILETLRNPADVWENPFAAQQDDFGRAIVSLVALNGTWIDQGELNQAYSRFISWPQNQGMNGRGDFLSNLKQLTGSLLSRTVSESLPEPRIDLFNPSIGDFVLQRLSGNLPFIELGFLSLRSASSFQTLLDLAKNEIIRTEDKLAIVRSVLKHAVIQEFSGYEARYVAMALLELAAADELDRRDELTLEAGFKFVVNEEIPSRFLEVTRMFRWAQRRGLVDEGQVHRFILAASKNAPSQDEFEALAELQQHSDEASETWALGWEELESAALAYLSENVWTEFDQGEVFADAEHDIEKAEEATMQLFQRWLTRVGIDCSPSALRSAVEELDLEGDCTKYFKNAREEGAYGGGGVQQSPVDEIDDLFDRS